ncbi:MAG: DNA replication/repair protein RecF [Armatimonadetes bacterium]|nr:DNA replication/repair protein RecF [Armatimonadota bacterium]
MHLTRLRLLNFRNHSRTTLDLGPRLNLFVGQNAQGKSSLLEAVEIAATGRSHRAARDVELLRFGESWARVHAAARRRDREVEVDVAWRCEGMGEGPLKEIRVNGVPVRRGELLGHVLAVVASPHDEHVVSGAPAHRRRLLDFLLAQISPAYFFTLLRYTRAVAQRNRLLRDLARASPRERDGALEAWDEQIASMGAAITARRRDIVDRLSSAVSGTYAELSGGSEGLTITYVPSLRATDESAMIAEARAALMRRRQDEIARGMTLCGPHRDDLLLQIDGRDLRAFGSRGQQQMAIVAVRLAERRTLCEEVGEEPVLLLDDTLQSLDEDRQARLLALLDRTQALVTVTATETLKQAPAGTAVYRVAGGEVQVWATA